ncbi:molybdenum cofactor biosynthesis protein MoaC [Tilletiaria anomala UBC 951]|uniref:cyclic pyranopterin monophosphate synthase n=1 Tax=Tilletiaria anomala (strain ATCC 24038 / CBS 436.72 / UBC 951) TaxID=1037660 RepID=A0A066WRW5_TILAU|nr:molybdenum cofactor biosynthesis protein MoaC [Tilletiaria anomala UBC 951]KDN53395.1 molybdenum cofactor biosynthesis protein MoaC [Tilletiaria anomala UBC 951]
MRGSIPQPSHSTSRDFAAASGFTHVDEASGQVRMVDISSKTSTKRTATARGRVWLPRAAMNALRASEQSDASSAVPVPASTKGPVVQTAQLAGIMGAKRTSDLIPLCHPLALTKVAVHITFDDDEELEPEGGYLVVECTASTTGQTGVEMEALTGVSVACLTIWDMAKAVAGREMYIEDLKVIAKSGGKSGAWQRSD